MRSNILKIVPPFSKDDLLADANKVLEDCKSYGFESVIVFGFRDERVLTKTSKSISVLTLIGALEAAKRKLWE